ncbi:MAG TPA: DNA gyrase C-terminal beta-propeller domain-containing protein, partial [Anaerovoracaceae bacterium]|nr:DNA gyrase C-terminal beta-propeller domain-containing protein [Anaerovoracaceae bacterium]
NRKTGLIAINLKDDDQLIGIKETKGNNNVIIVTKNGKCICFSEEDVRSMGRIAGGVRAIKLEKDDEVVAMELVEPTQELLVVTQKGYGKRTPVEEYKVQVRGGKGLLTYDKAKFKKTGELIGAMAVDKDDEVLLINSDGIIIRIRAGEVSKLGRATQGVRIMKVNEDVNIVAMAKVIKEDEIDDGETEPPKGKKGDSKAEPEAEEKEDGTEQLNLEV